MMWGSVTRLRVAASINAHGSNVRNWSAASPSPIVDVKVQPVASTESDMKVTRARLFSKPGTLPDVTAFDRIVSDGLTWQVQGDPAVFADVLPHIEAGLVRVTG